MDDSILLDIKKVLNVPADYDVFDADIIMHINSALTDVNQIGIGPLAGFEIKDSSATWTSLLGGDPRLNSVKSLIFLKVKMLFDPPAQSFTQSAIDKQITEMMWRLEVMANPAPPVPDKTFVDPYAEEVL